MSNEQEEALGVDSVVAAVPQDLVAAFFTGDPRAIGAALGQNREMLAGMLKGLPKQTLRGIAEDIGGVLSDEGDGDDDGDGPIVSRAGPRRRADVIDADTDVPDDADDVEEDENDGQDEVDEDDEGSFDPVAAMNELGKGISSMISDLPGVALGITFAAGGRKVEVAYYYPATRSEPAEVLAQARTHTARFGDTIDALYAEVEARVQAEIEDDGELDDEDDVDADADVDEDLEAEGEEIVEAPRPRRRVQAQPQTRRRR